MSARTTVTPERHLIARSAINTAVLMVSLCAGKTPQQIAAEVAARAITALRAKTSNQGNAAMSEITTTTVQRIQTPAEITELHRVIESRWMKGGSRP